MTPLPRFASWDAFNGHLEEQCRNRQGNVLRGHRESIGERFVRDREALKRPLPAPFDACDKQGTRVNSLSLVRYRTNDYSVPVAYGHQEVWIRGYVHEVVIGCLGIRRLWSRCAIMSQFKIKRCGTQSQCLSSDCKDARRCDALPPGVSFDLDNLDVGRPIERVGTSSGRLSRTGVAPVGRDSRQAFESAGPLHARRLDR